MCDTWMCDTWMLDCIVAVVRAKRPSGTLISLDWWRNSVIRDIVPTTCGYGSGSTARGRCGCARPRTWLLRRYRVTPRCQPDIANGSDITACRSEHCGQFVGWYIMDSLVRDCWKDIQPVRSLAVTIRKDFFGVNFTVILTQSLQTNRMLVN